MRLLIIKLPPYFPYTIEKGHCFETPKSTTRERDFGTRNSERDMEYSFNILAVFRVKREEQKEKEDPRLVRLCVGDRFPRSFETVCQTFSSVLTLN
jgi:hypothetical protein